MQKLTTQVEFLNIIHPLFDFTTTKIGPITKDLTPYLSGETYQKQLFDVLMYITYAGNPEAKELAQLMSEYGANLSALHREFVNHPYQHIPWASFLKDQYNQIVGVQNERGSADMLLKTIENRTLSQLILSAHYSYLKGNFKSTSELLKYATEVGLFPNLMEYIADISGGYEVPKEFKEGNLRSRKEWIAHQLKLAYAISGRSRKEQIHEREIKSIKKAFIVQPFNTAILKALIKIFASQSHKEREIGDMIQYGVEHNSSVNALEVLLVESICHCNLAAAQFIVSRIIQLKSFKSLVLACECVLTYRTNVSIQMKGIMKAIIEVYDNFVSTENRLYKGKLVVRYKEIMGQPISFSILNENHTCLINELSLIQKPVLQKEEHILINLVEEGSIKLSLALDAAFQGMLQIGNHTRVLNMYDLLAEKSPELGTLYFSSIVPYEMISNL